jgi:hypothetical protein
MASEMDKGFRDKNSISLKIDKFEEPKTWFKLL